MMKFAAQPISIPKIWQAGIGIYRATFAKVWYLLIATVIISSGFLLTIKTLSSKLFLSDPVLSQSVHMPKIAAILVILLLILLGIYINCLLLHRIYKTLTANNVSLKESCKVALKKYGSCILSLVYLLLVFIGVVLALCLLVAFISFIWALLQKFFPALAVLKLGSVKIVIFTLFALAIFVGVSLFFIIETVLLFAWPLILLEDHRAWRAIKVSWQLVKGNICRIASGIFIPISILMIPFSIFHWVIFLNQVQSVVLWCGYYVVYILVYAFLVFPLRASLILAQFNDLKLRRDMMIVWVPKNKNNANS